MIEMISPHFQQGMHQNQENTYIAFMKDSKEYKEYK